VIPHVQIISAIHLQTPFMQYKMATRTGDIKMAENNKRRAEWKNYRQHTDLACQVLAISP